MKKINQQTMDQSVNVLLAIDKVQRVLNYDPD